METYTNEVALDWLGRWHVVQCGCLNPYPKVPPSRRLVVELNRRRCRCTFNSSPREFDGDWDDGHPADSAEIP